MDEYENREWWKESFVYQIYPQSFNDTDGDGVGDIQGIIERLEYLEALGVDIVWLNPLYASPHVDDGYDIADYRAIRDAYGTMSDFETLLEGMHARGMRLIMDLVVNHTSDEHVWFQKSRREEGAYADYYWWRDGDERDGERVPPNNWTSGFGGSAWTWDDEREQYYLHLFAEKQPDLNWENEVVREEVYDMITWWLEKGIDGFRMDVFNLISKPPDLPDGDPERDWVGSEHFANGPRVHEYINEMVDETFSNDDVMTVGESIDGGLEEANRYCGPTGDGLNMIFHYEYMLLDFDEEEGWWVVDPWELNELRAIISRWQTELTGDAWNTIFLGTHDFPRIVSRWGDDDTYHRASATLLATLLFTLRGTPFCYQGDEIGMTNYPWTSLEQLEDADATNRVTLAIEEGRIDGFDDVRDLIRYRCRDNARTPMQWTGEEPHAGFTDGEPWLPVNPNYETINVEDARSDPHSIWHYYRDVIALRHDSDVLVYGAYELLTPDHDQIWAYRRTLEDEQVVVVLNWSDSDASIDCSRLVDDASTITTLLGNYDRADTGGENALEVTTASEMGSLTLRPYEARVYR